jgi:hypothetical protein
MGDHINGLYYSRRIADAALGGRDRVLDVPALTIEGRVLAIDGIVPTHRSAVQPHAECLTRPGVDRHPDGAALLRRPSCIVDVAMRDTRHDPHSCSRDVASVVPRDYHGCISS